MKTKYFKIELFFYFSILFIACEKDPIINQGNYKFDNNNLIICSNPIDTVDIPTVNNDSITISEIINSMIYIESGSFWMGAQSNNNSGTNYDSDADIYESPVHYVTLSNYYIGKYEVTQKQWETVMGSNPSFFIGDNLPVERVSWNDIQDFIYKLKNLTGYTFRLPTEAEWEYAARGGKHGNGCIYSGSNSITQVAWFDENSLSSTHPVGLKQTNEIGAFDMCGNVCEWCQDWFGEYNQNNQLNPQGSLTGSCRTIRGGCWDQSYIYCRISNRFYYLPEFKNSYIGFRLIRVSN